MDVPIEMVVVAIANVAVVAAAFAAVKNDTRWIKDKLKMVDKVVNGHGKQLNRHDSELLLVKQNCKNHHGTEFPEIPSVEVGNSEP